ncbi:DMSO/selenate family reductase complex B subunit [Paraferrimonas sedimenticola]|uniref:Dimethylsulfoxide reductase, chain B n=1 Tax=Paraferrimonas sedimenticola TaxID=375674 RepID=A0AA37W1P7_9GAMM|nr:DMSO/selenate family reductase complex B subunit [Paraferrimonas sedimenticola]GLP97063.1 dimethylsulfoxide reductase, chain B [Paraferrimonas sedimenticola]
MIKDEQYGFYVDATKCTGCKACHVACKDRKDLPLGVTWRRVYEYGGGSVTESNDGTFAQNVFAYYSSIGCNHCSDPVCVKACPTGAMFKRTGDGIVQITENLCIACEACARACPYDAPQIDNDRKVMTKCDGCSDRLEEGKNTICVEACPMRVLDFDTMTALVEKYGEGDSHMAPLPPESITTPNLIVKAPRDAQPAGGGTGQILNDNEV